MITLSETIADVARQILVLLIITLFLFSYMHSVSEWKNHTCIPPFRIAIAKPARE